MSQPLHARQPKHDGAGEVELVAGLYESPRTIEAQGAHDGLEQVRSGPGERHEHLVAPPVLESVGVVGNGLGVREHEAAAMAMMMGSTTEPNGSRCLAGFRVSLPASLAVSSPHRWAT